VDKLLDSLDESYATIISEIKERPDFEELHYAEIMTLLSIHEEKFGLGNPLPRYSSEEGEIFSDYGSSHESEEHEEEDVENQHSIQRGMEILTERLSQLRSRNLQLTNSLEANETSSRRLPPMDTKCYKCKMFGHVIKNCPDWDLDFVPGRRWKEQHCSGFFRVDRHTKLPRKNDSEASSSTRPVTDLLVKAAINFNMKKISEIARARAIINMKSDDESNDSDSDSDDKEEFY
jgi:hypothetical protein